MRKTTIDRSWVSRAALGASVVLLGLLLSSCIAASPGENAKEVRDQRTAPKDQGVTPGRQGAGSTETFISKSTEPFISTWKMHDAGETLTLPLVAEGNYDFTVDWGDGNSNTITSWNDGEATHTYTEAGEYTVTITGAFEGWRFASYAEAKKLLDISQFGGMALGAVDSHFAGASKLVEFSASDAPDLSKTTSLRNTFRNASKFNGDLSKWDVSGVADMSSMFRQAVSFNQPIGGWDVSSVKDMRYMFKEATAFRQDISSWDLSSASKYYEAFLNSGTPAAQQAPKLRAFISKWKIDTAGESVSLPLVAEGSYDFLVHWGDGNQDIISAWDATASEHTYTRAGEYTLTITGAFEGWRFVDDPAVTNPDYGDAAKLIDISQWGGMALGAVDGHFAGASKLVGTASDAPNLSSTTSLKNTFRGATKFNGDISTWDVSNITDMSYMFSHAESFNQDISSWNVARVKEYDDMFLRSPIEEAHKPQFNRAFISKWKTGSLGSRSSRQITLPLVREGNYDFTVDWGDGNSDTITSWNAREATHTYRRAGEYTVSITGIFEGWRFAGNANARKLLDISQWGGMALGAVDSHFAGASNLVGTASDAPDLSKTTSFFKTFYNARKFNGDLSKWDVSRIITMERTFERATVFNGAISKWDVSSVENMDSMFYNADSFNRPIGKWNVSAVKNMGSMFNNADSFNQAIGEWDVSAVSDMNWMFSYASSFNQDIDGGKDGWDVSAVTDMNNMFQGAHSFDQPIGKWDVSSVEDMNNMFYMARSFNQGIGDWDVSAVRDMRAMFRLASSFNQDINTKGNSWNVSAVRDMRLMFNEAKDFNQPIGKWDVSAVTNMRAMFKEAEDFNQPIGKWDVSAVTNMKWMFSYASSFNQDISEWVVSSVENMSYMFYDARAFNQPIRKWDVSSVENMSAMFHGASSFNQDISSWDVAQVRNYSGIFRSCPIVEAYKPPRFR